MSKKKIRWTLENVQKVNIASLDKTELARAYSFAAHRLNSEIRKLKDFETETGYRSPSLDFIEIKAKKGTVNSKKGQGIFDIENPYKVSQNELRRELSRMQKFMSLSSSSMKKTKALISKQKDTVIKVTSELGMDLKKSDITLDDLSDFYSIFREALEDENFKTFGSDQLREAVWQTYKKYGYQSFGALVNDIKEEYNKLYETKQEVREKRREELERAEKKFRKKGRKKNSSKDWEDL